MMWYVIIFFAALNADNSQQMYVFTKPTFETEAQCRFTLTDKKSVESYTMKLVEAYDGKLPGRIRGVNCIPQKLFEQLQELNDKGARGITI